MSPGRLPGRLSLERDPPSAGPSPQGAEKAMHQPAETRDPAPAGDLSPRHGFQGDRGAPSGPRPGPAALTIALSREAGARGATIGRRVGRKLGWAVYDKELLEYMAQEEAARQGMSD